jgi:hypothetical protein
MPQGRSGRLTTCLTPPYRRRCLGDFGRTTQGADMRLNGLQHVGVVASVCWALGSGIWFAGKTLQDYSRRLDSRKALQSSAFNLFHFRIASSFGAQINGPTLILRKRIHAAAITRLTSAMQTEDRGILSE